MGICCTPLGTTAISRRLPRRSSPPISRQNLADLRTLGATPSGADRVYFIPPYEWYNRDQVAWSRHLDVAIANFYPRHAFQPRLRPRGRPPPSRRRSRFTTTFSSSPSGEPQRPQRRPNAAAPRLGPQGSISPAGGRACATNSPAAATSPSESTNCAPPPPWNPPPAIPVTRRTGGRPRLPQAAPSWEILPQAAGAGEVILSKRNELGLLSNFAPTPFTFRGQRYASVEGFWQMMKYPEGADDRRAQFGGNSWKYTRKEVAAMTAFEAKAAGDLGSKNMNRMGIDWVSFEGEHFPYRPAEPGRHHDLIVAAMRAKLEQNPEVQRVLLATGDLVLKPDHHQEANAPAAWRYFDIWMQFRAELQHEIKSHRLCRWTCRNCRCNPKKSTGKAGGL